MFKSHEEIFTKLLQDFFNDPSLKFDYNRKYAELPQGDKTYKFQEKIELSQNNNVLYEVSTHPYYYCCGITNIGDLHIINRIKSHNRLVTIFMGLLVFYLKVKHNSNVMNLTIPNSHSGYAKGYKVFTNLKKGFTNTELKFYNTNSGNHVSHISYIIEDFDLMRKESTKILYGYGTLESAPLYYNNIKTHIFEILNKL